MRKNFSNFGNSQDFLGFSPRDGGRSSRDDGAGHDAGDDRGGDRGGDRNGSEGDQRGDRGRGRDQRIATPEAQTVANGAAFSLQLERTRAGDDDVYLFSATGLPGGLAIDATSGLISGTVNAEPGSFPVTVSFVEAHEAAGHRPRTIAFQITVTEGASAFAATLAPESFARRRGGDDPTDNGLTVGSAGWMALESVRHSLKAYFQNSGLTEEVVQSFAVSVTAADKTSLTYLVPAQSGSDECLMQDHYSRSGLTKILGCVSAPYYLWRQLTPAMDAEVLLGAATSAIRLAGVEASVSSVSASWTDGKSAVLVSLSAAAQTFAYTCSPGLAACTLR